MAIATPGRRARRGPDGRTAHVRISVAFRPCSNSLPRKVPLQRWRIVHSFKEGASHIADNGVASSDPQPVHDAARLRPELAGPMARAATPRRESKVSILRPEF